MNCFVLPFVVNCNGSCQKCPMFSGRTGPRHIVVLQANVYDDVCKLLCRSFELFTKVYPIVKGWDSGI